MLWTTITALALAAGAIASPTPHIAPRDGCTLSWNGTDITGYQDGPACRYTIRYGSAKRWEYPVAAQNQSGVDSTKFPPMCAQDEKERLAPAEDDFQPMSEDCQFFTLYAPPNITKESKLPVFFWIHGGSYISGSASDKGLNGSAMAVRDDIVVVFTQYRLGALGHAPPPNAPTGGDPNYALKDVVTSLEVIRDNIGGAGGDPAAVTVGGQSAGGSMTRTLWGTPSAKGLFRALILHSDPINFGTQGPDETENLQKLLYDNSSGNGTLLAQQNCTDFACWQSANLSLVLNASSVVNHAGPNKIREVAQGEVYRPSYGTVTLPQDPTNALFYNVSNLGVNVSEVPVMLTTTRNESGYLIEEVLKANVSASDVMYNISVNQFVRNQTQTDLILQSGHYGQEQNPDGLRQAMEVMITDVVWRCASRAIGHQWAKQGGRMWIGEWNRGIQYTFDDGSYCSQNNVVCHGDDVYPTFDSQPANKTQEDEYPAWGPDIHAAWVSFIKHGDPTKAGLEWKQWGPESTKDDVYNIGQRNEIKDCPADLWGTEKFPWYWQDFSNDTIVDLGYANQTAVDNDAAPQATAAQNSTGQVAGVQSAAARTTVAGGVTLAAVLVAMLL